MVKLFIYHTCKKYSQQRSNVAAIVAVESAALAKVNTASGVFPFKVSTPHLKRNGTHTLIIFALANNDSETRTLFLIAESS
jgi:hypothetical protein